MKRRAIVPAYNYEVVDASGQALKGRLEAGSPVDVVRRLGADGLTVVNVAEARQDSPQAFRRAPRLADMAVAFRELATLLESGVALGDAVRAQSRGSHHPAVAAAFDVMAQGLLRGKSFLQALTESRLPLPDYALQLAEAGEASGQLGQALRRAVEQMEYDRRVAADLRGALTYPAVLAVAGVSAVVLVFLFVVPQFGNLLDEGNNLPWLAAAVLTLGVWFNANWWLLVAMAAALAIGAAALLRNPAGRQRAADFVAALPVLREWFSEADTARWAAVLSAMLASRVELMDALGLAGRGIRVSVRRERLRGALADVRGGAALSAALQKQDALTATGYNLIRVGEQSGRLAETLRALATLCEEGSARRMKRVLALLEPLAVLLIGVVLGTIMIGLMLAITSVNEVVL